MPAGQQIWAIVLLVAQLGLLGVGCGKDRLPGFADPPPVDAGDAGE